MKIIKICFLLSVVVLLGCASTVQRVQSLPDFHTPPDYNLQNQCFTTLERIGNAQLKAGMTPEQVRRVLGEPKRKGKSNHSVEGWTYLTSISGTFAYCVIFVEGKLDFFGQCNPHRLVEKYVTKRKTS